MDRWKEHTIKENHAEDREVVIRIARRCMSDSDRDLIISRIDDIYSHLIKTKRTGKLLQDMLLEFMSEEELKARLRSGILTVQISEREDKDRERKDDGK